MEGWTADSISTFWWDLNVISMKEEDSAEIWIGSLIIICGNLNCGVKDIIDTKKWNCRAYLWSIPENDIYRYDLVSRVEIAAGHWIFPTRKWKWPAVWNFQILNMSDGVIALIYVEITKWKSWSYNHTVVNRKTWFGKFCF